MENMRVMVYFFIKMEADMKVHGKIINLMAWA